MKRKKRKERKKRTKRAPAVVRPAGSKLARGAVRGTLTKRHPSVVDDFFSRRFSQCFANNLRTVS